MQFTPRNLVLRLFLFIPLIVGLSGCGEKVTLKNDSLASAQTTASNEIVYPDDDPSVPDGKAVWANLTTKSPETNCASCHGMNGEGTPQVPLNFSDKDHMRKQKPVDQFATIWLGKLGEGKSGSHPALHGIVSRRDAWNLVFYVRSLAVAPLT